MKTELCARSAGICFKRKYDDYAEEITEYASTGSRVLAFGIYDGEVDGKPLTHGILPFGFVLLANPIREAAKETFEYFAEQGVEVKVISGIIRLLFPMLQSRPELKMQTDM